MQETRDDSQGGHQTGASDLTAKDGYEAIIIGRSYTVPADRLNEDQVALVEGVPIQYRGVAAVILDGQQDTDVRIAALGRLAHCEEDSAAAVRQGVSSHPALAQFADY